MVRSSGQRAVLPPGAVLHQVTPPDCRPISHIDLQNTAYNILYSKMSKMRTPSQPPNPLLPVCMITKGSSVGERCLLVISSYKCQNDRCRLGIPITRPFLPSPTPLATVRKCPFTQWHLLCSDYNSDWRVITKASLKSNLSLFLITGTQPYLPVHYAILLAVAHILPVTISRQH